MVDWLAARSLLSPVLAIRRRVKKWGADRLALIREGSEVVTPLIELAKTIGPTGIMWGEQAEIQQRFVGWAEEWDRLRPALLTYANAHPSEEIKTEANELVPVFGASFGSTRYLWLQLSTSETMEDFNVATERQKEAVAAAEKLLEKIRRY
jgi:hypothetical protein